jgi:hypothetical protein
MTIDINQQTQKAQSIQDRISKKIHHGETAQHQNRGEKHLDFSLKACMMMSLSPDSCRVTVEAGGR